MMSSAKRFGGKALLLDRDDINTDEIIPAKYLTEISKEALKPYLLEDLKLASFDPKEDVAQKEVIITRKNFGCGSSREHAPWALEVNGITLVIAENFSRIFRQNMYNCGMLAVELGSEQIDELFARFAGTPCSVSVDLEEHVFVFSSEEGEQLRMSFSISEFDEKLIAAGGWVEFADQNY